MVKNEYTDKKKNSWKPEKLIEMIFLHVYVYVYVHVHEFVTSCIQVYVRMCVHTYVHNLCV